MTAENHGRRQGRRPDTHGCESGISGRHLLQRRPTRAPRCTSFNQASATDPFPLPRSITPNLIRNPLRSKSSAPSRGAERSGKKSRKLVPKLVPTTNDGWKIMRSQGKVLILQRAPVAQLDRAFDYETGRFRRTDPRLIRKQFTFSGFGGFSQNSL